MNKITIEKAGTVERLTIPDDAIGDVMAELTERFGKRDGFVDGQRCWVINTAGDINSRRFDDDNYEREAVLMGSIFHTEAEAIAAKERRLTQERLRKAYLAVTGGAEIEGREFFVPYYNGHQWMYEDFTDDFFPIPYRFATAEQAAAFGRDNGDDLIRMMSV